MDYESCFSYAAFPSFSSCPPSWQGQSSLVAERHSLFSWPFSCLYGQKLPRLHLPVFWKSKQMPFFSSCAGKAGSLAPKDRFVASRNLSLNRKLHA